MRKFLQSNRLSESQGRRKTKVLAKPYRKSVGHNDVSPLGQKMSHMDATQPAEPAAPMTTEVLEGHLIGVDPQESPHDLERQNFAVAQRGSGPAPAHRRSPILPTERLAQGISYESPSVAGPWERERDS